MDNISLKRKLNLSELGILETEMQKKRKSKETAWGLWACLSFFGAHRFYTENYKYASAMFLTSSIPIAAIIILLFYTDLQGIYEGMFWLFTMMLIGSAIWSWIDAFFLNRRLNVLNNEKEMETLQEILKSRE